MGHGLKPTRTGTFVRAALLAAGGAALLGPAACRQVIDLDGYTSSTAETEAPPDTTTSTTTCSSGEVRPCSAGPEDPGGDASCASGTQTCADGVWGACEGAAPPSAENCATLELESCLSPCPDPGLPVWAVSEVEDDTKDRVAGVAVDSHDDVLVAGNVGDTLFVEKRLGVDGSRPWRTTFPVGQGAGVAVDPSDDVWITGSFTGTLAVGGETFTAGDQDIFVIRLSGGTGEPLFAMAVSGAGNQEAVGIACDAGGGVFVAARYDGTLAWGGAAFASVDGAGPSAFVGRLSTSGVPDWGHAFAELSGASLTGLAADAQGEVIVTGQSKGPVADKDGSPSDTGQDIFVAKLDAAGGLAWTTQVKGKAEESSPSVAVSPEGDRIFVAGLSMSGTIDFSPQGECTPLAGVTDSPQSLVLVTFGADGRCLKGSRFSGTWTDPVLGARPTGEIVLSGHVTGKRDFPCQKLQDVFVAEAFVAMIRQDLSVTCDFVQPYSTGTLEPTGVAVDSTGAILLGGAFQGSLDMGGDVELTSAPSGVDVFVARIAADRALSGGSP